MKIKFSPSTLTQIKDENNVMNTVYADKGQSVNFFNVLENKDESFSTKPTEMSYDDNVNIALRGVALLNFSDFTKAIENLDESGNTSDDFNLIIYNSQGYVPVRYNDEMTVSIFRQEVEVEKDTEGNVTNVNILTPYVLVATDVKRYHLRDYNISNNRYYRYVIYPTQLKEGNTQSALQKEEFLIENEWAGWSITELHPVDSTMKKFSVSSSDVWVFNLGVETGQQTQHFIRNEQQTLGQFSRYAQGRQNYISGNVSCYLGSQFLPANYVQKNGTWQNIGGYQEKMPFSQKISSNDKVNMLLQWRKVVHSPNPKLLKDRKGQSFLITINESSNQPQDNIKYQPDKISFTWTQIGDTEGIEIIDTSI